MIFWREQMSVCNESIDDQHRYLISLINCIELGLGTERLKEVLPPCIDQLIHYTEHHFAHEEKLMHQIGYTGWPEHRRQHLSIVEDLREGQRRMLKVLSLQDDDVAAGAQEAAAEPELDLQACRQQLTPLTELFRHWVIDHVLGTDRELTPYLKQHPRNLS